MIMEPGIVLNLLNTSSDEFFHLSDVSFLNSSIDEIECYLSFFNQSFQTSEGGPYCNGTWDGVTCWPATPGGAVAILPCVSELKGITYDTTQNASRMCHRNGSWAAKSDYSRCKPIMRDDFDDFALLWDVKEAATIYYVGYGVSLVALIIALWIFLYFKDLRCLRNTIHTNLMVTYVLIDLTWIITATLQSTSAHDAHKAACMMVIFLTYLMGTNFFWMFVEGLYLYILVVKTFSIELVKFYIYALIGWGIPAVVTIAWASVKGYYTPYPPTNPFEPSGCPWQSRDDYDYIFMCPVILVLVINIFFLGEIMWVLITKLRAATSVESKQYRKAAKALLVLIPLLGITYVVVIVTPSHRTARVVFTYLQATLLSTQGFTVAVLYCFLNGEVRNSLRYHLERWKTQRGLGQTPRHSLTYRSSLHGESVRLYSNRAYRDRGSCMSFSTTTTCVANNCSFGHRNSNGSYGLVPARDDVV